MKTESKGAVYALSAASLYALNVPFSKLLLSHVGPTVMAAFLYLGAGLGLLIYGAVERLTGRVIKREPLTKKELPYTVAMVVLDIAAPILLMFGIRASSSAGVSLLSNFEIVATSVIALAVFGERISKKLWLAIALVTLAGAVLSFDGAETFSLSGGSLLVLGACLCWGLENNCTKKISNKSSVEIVVIKGTFSGLGSLVVAVLSGESLPELYLIPLILLLGFVAYGLSIHFYITAQKVLGAAKTGAYYSVVPFLGVIFSFILLGERPGVQFYIALVIMLAATALMVRDTVPAKPKN